MDVGNILYWLIPILMIVVGLFLFLKSFFHQKNTSSAEINFHDKQIPVVPRNQRDDYLAQQASLGANDRFEPSVFDEETEGHAANHETLHTAHSPSDDALVFTTDTAEHADVDALGDTLSSLEHATADIMPVVNKGEPDSFSGNSQMLDTHLQDQEEQDQIAVLKNSEEVVSVTLLPNASINFDGQAIMDILDSYGLKFGEMNLYHRYVNPKGTGQLLFSVMRYTEKNDSQPFDIQTLSDETVDGLTFFMPLPHPKAVESIGAMLSLSGSIANDIRATVHNENFEVLTAKDKDALKEYVAKYGTN